MKLKGDAGSAFERASRVSALSGASRPEFASVRVDVVDGQAQLVVMSDGLWFRSAVPSAGAGEDMSFSLPAKLAADTFRRISDGASLDVSEDVVVVSSGRSRYRMRRTSVCDAIVFPGDAAGTEFRFDRVDLLDAVASVLPAAARDSSLGPLSAVRVEFSSEGLALVATDSYRMAVARLPLPVPSDGRERSFLLGVRELALMLRLFARSEQVTVSLPLRGEGWLEFGDGVSSLRVGVLSGQFPDWRKVLMSRPDFDVDVDPAGFSDLLAELAVYGPQVSMRIDDGVLEASASDSAGDVVSSLDVTCLSEGSREVRFQGSFLADAVAALGAGPVRMSVGASRAALWLSSGSRTHLVMPVTSPSA